MAKTLEAHDKLIREIFEGSYQFEIPDYQRPYAWTTEQATELFDDLYSAMQDAHVSGASSQYFLGSIVLIKNDRDPKSSVVDGQQRLSTLTMLFAVLRTVLPDAADDITDFLYKKGKVSLGEKNEYRLTAREEDADFFRTTAGDVKSRAYAKEWSRIENSLGRDAFGDLFGHIRSIYAKRKQKYILAKEFQEHVTEYKTPIDLVDKVIKPYAEVWDFVRDANFEATEHAETINEHLSWLNRVDFKDWVPPALVYFRRFRQQPKRLAEFFQSLERLTYFLLVTKVGINERIETYAALTKEIEPETFEGDMAELTTLALTDAQKRKFVAALDGDVYDDLPKARMALVLRLEFLVRAPGVQLQDAVSLEHVLPQTPPDGSDWIKWFPNEDERDGWTHRLANLVPLDRNKNSSASNYDFSKKKDAYFRGKGTASPFVLTQEVRSEGTWTPELLTARQKRLVDVLKDHRNLAVATGTAAS